MIMLPHPGRSRQPLARPPRHPSSLDAESGGPIALVVIAAGAAVIALGILRGGGGNADVTAWVLPNVNHLVLADTSDDFAKYNTRPTNVVGPDVPGVIADWAALKLGQPAPRS